ncbi:MAG: hypothetical protein PHS41_04865 [Victivallaceae bacterium]|nr:hypothetical protein [Victivallaceae bacterium]
MFTTTCRTNNDSLDLAYRIALGTLAENIVWRKQTGAMTKDAPVVVAGLGYRDPWTRDSAFNAWYAAALLAPRAAEEALRSVVEKTADGWSVHNGGYWDAVIWIFGAWNDYIRTGDDAFLAWASEVATCLLTYNEENELDNADGLFRGGACFQDGISAYPEKFLTSQGDSGIFDCTRRLPRPAYLKDKGVGIPCKALSTNVLYYLGYRCKDLMEGGQSVWAAKAEKLAEAIERGFFDPVRNRYRYLLDAEDPNPEREEALGHAFLLISGLAQGARAKRILAYAHRTPQGVPCLWPPYERYAARPEKYGRHCGTIWPQVNAAWALGAAAAGDFRTAFAELALQTARTVRDNGFFELYHPETGMPYAGIQERPGCGMCMYYPSNPGQTWCATGYLAMVHEILFGVHFQADGVTVSPTLPEGMNHAELHNLPCRGAVLNLFVSRDSAQTKKRFLPAEELKGEITLNLGTNAIGMI